MCSFLSFKRFILVRHRSVKSGCSLSALHECDLMEFSEAVSFQDHTIERRIKPGIII